MKDDLLYEIALTKIPELGAVLAKALLEHFGNATAVFKARKKELARIDGIGEARAMQIKTWNNFSAAEEEIRFMEKNHIQVLFITHPQYPQRLLHCYDAPTLLYYRGTASLNHSKVISIIGTRNNTEYGKWATEQLVQSLQPLQVLIVSGLAFGIDAIAHKTALQQQLPTVGVLGHGFHYMYPPQHKTLANEMLHQGGLITEFGKDAGPDKHHFPRRNRIVAGMSDATVVIETAVKGGSMITADLACGYHRDLFALPGKLSDPKSMGCLKLIQQNKAILLTGGEQLIEVMGWLEKKRTNKKQRILFPELNEAEKKIVDLLTEKENMHVDELYLKSALSSSTVAAALLNLELQNVIHSLPGMMYRLC